jgi:hypothetical protein
VEVEFDFSPSDLKVLTNGRNLQEGGDCLQSNQLQIHFLASLECLAYSMTNLSKRQCVILYQARQARFYHGNNNPSLHGLIQYKVAS